MSVSENEYIFGLMMSYRVYIFLILKYLCKASWVTKMIISCYTFTGNYTNKYLRIRLFACEGIC